MNTFFVIVIVLLMVMVVVSLVRGIIAFLKTTRMDIENGTDNVREMQLQQNRMMFARVKYQALAIVVVVVMMLASR